jgi:hypothetical protein
MNKKHQVTEIIITFSGAVNAAEADNPDIYRLILPGKKGSHTARNAKSIALQSALYDAGSDSVTLIPTKPFAIKKPVQLQIDGLPPADLQDSSGRYIDGAGDGTAGSNGIAILSRGGVSVDAMALGTTRAQAFGIGAVVDALFESDEVIGGLVPRGARRRAGIADHGR